MNGIEVLKSIDIYTMSPMAKIGMIVLMIWLLFELLSLFISIANRDELSCIILIIVIIIIVISSCALYRSKYKYSHTEYQIKISEEINLDEFNEQYEIIHKDGEIYTIKEINKEN